MPKLHSAVADSTDIHVPKGFTEAANETVPNKDSFGNLIWVDQNAIGGVGPAGPAGPAMPAWVTATNYSTADVVYSDVADATENKIYRATSSHTSSGTLLGDIANWEELSPSEFIADDTARVTLSTGLLSGCVLSINADNTKYDMTAGTGLHIDHTTTPGTPIVITVTIPAVLAGTVTNLATQSATFICIDSSGSVVEKSTRPSPSDRRDLITIGALAHIGGVTIDEAASFPDIASDTGDQLGDLMQALGFFSLTGNGIAGNGGTLTVQKETGTGFARDANFQTNPKDPHTVNLPALNPAVMTQVLQDATFITQSTLIDPTQYDNAGVLTTVSNGNNATIARIYLFSNNQLVYLFGQEVFSTMAAALDSVGRESFVEPTNLREGLLLARLVMKKNATDSTDVNEFSIIISSGVSSGGGTVSTMQQTYDVSSTPEIIVDAVRGAVTIRDNATPVGAELWEVEKNNGDKIISASVGEVKVETQAYSALNTLVDAANIATDCEDGNVHTVTLTGNRTFDAPTNLKAGATYIWIIKQDATGLRLGTFDATFVFPLPPTLQTAADAVDIVSAVYDGSVLRAAIGPGWPS